MGAQWLWARRAPGPFSHRPLSCVLHLFIPAGQRECSQTRVKRLGVGDITESILPGFSGPPCLCLFHHLREIHSLRIDSIDLTILQNSFVLYCVVRASEIVSVFNVFICFLGKSKRGISCKVPKYDITKIFRLTVSECLCMVYVLCVYLSMETAVFLCVSVCPHQLNHCSTFRPPPPSPLTLSNVPPAFWLA